MPQSEGTPVVLTIGTVKIPAHLNTTVTAQRLVERLPYTVRAQRFADDYCGTAEPLETDPSELQAGWKDGDIGYGGGYFSILLQGQEHSQSYTDMMIVGHIDDTCLAVVRELPASVTVTVDRNVWPSLTVTSRP